ncbi:cysteine--tRNA ligase [Aestuariispira insulae]|uniref:Cysteine--tRNA ligase n=1 Tax=Aestuariispira insulae TaxID=1461337 RepID=A0A3D9HYE0_9PROT|nr:cysteine--tRNA ligase [Aestuariispira insulae]RED53926.1 cysteinyl-tRNA synthetase [Aestuariispira insulae]
MSLKIYDTARREKVAFEPIDANDVRLYVCGPTVYDYIHIGNARPLVVFDVLYRLLKASYPSVKYVRNITDVDDKINARARENGESIRDLTERTNDQFQSDAKAIGCLEPDVQPRATEHIQEMQDIIARLIARGHAYAAEGHVLFDTKSWDDYGKFANKDLEELEAGARVEVAPYKKNAADFVLWKPSDDDTPGWDSPWGRGRPGWHIECSAMSAKHLGESFDIHGGGLDLIFPHHQNEVAQSCCGNEADRGFAKYWMHNGYLMSEGEKMSKSLGNFYTVHELLEDFPGEALRLVILQTHYRQPLDFSKDKLREAKAMLDRMYGALREVADVEAVITDSDPVLDALTDDVNTAKAMAALHEAVGDLNKAATDADKAAAKGRVELAGRLLGILQQDPEAWFKGDAGDDDAGEIEALIQKRADAKAAKDFATADAVRDELTARGIVLEDKPGGKTEWRRS